MHSVSRISAILLALAWPELSTASYSVQTYFDAGTGNIESRVYWDNQHFGSFLSTANGAQVFRPHPDQSQPDGWGTSFYLTPFLAGADPRLGSLSIASSASGIDFSISGQVAKGATESYGTYSLNGHMVFNAVSESIQSDGNLSIHLSGPLGQAGGDLNLNRIASNFLHDVPRQPPTGGIGDTGDISQVRYYFDVNRSTGDIWNPVSQPGHFPQLTASFVGFDLQGELNTADVVALGRDTVQINVADKPNVRLEYFTENGDAILSAGMFWDASQGQNPYADNIGINHLILKNLNGNVQNFSLKFNFESSTVVPLPTSIIFFISGISLICIRKKASKRFAS